jgi:asparagine synthetase B (glutamine-hydrolysing)
MRSSRRTAKTVTVPPVTGVLIRARNVAWYPASGILRFPTAGHGDPSVPLGHRSSLTAVRPRRAKALGRFNGMFAFAIWDRDEQRLFLARDRIGIKPLYYCLRDGELIFASELKAILQHPRVDRRLNLLSVSKYFTYGYVPTPHTIFEGGHKLEPGSYLLFDRTGLRKTMYWDIPLDESTKRTQLPGMG